MSTVGLDRLNEAIASIGASEEGEKFIREEYQRLTQDYNKWHKKIHIFWDDDEYTVTFDIAGVGSVVVQPRIPT